MQAVSAPINDTRRSSWSRRRAELSALALVVLVMGWVLPPRLAFALIIGVAVVACTLRWPVVGFVLFAWSVPWSTAIPLPLSSVTTTDLLAALVAGVWLSQAAFERRNPMRTGMWTPYLLLFLAAIALSVTQASDRHASANELVKWLEMSVVYWSACQTVRGERQILLVIAAIITSGVSQALLGYVQTALQLGPQAFTHGLLLRAYGTFDQPNPYAGYLNMTIPFAIALAALHPRQSIRRLCWLAATLILVALVASQSRGALLATMLALAVLIAILWRGGRWTVGLTTLAGAVGAWGASLGLVPLGPFQRVLAAAGLGSISFADVNDANFSAVERAAHWLAGVRMFAAHPLLGVGIGNYAAAYPMYHPRGWYAALAHAHNYYINIAAEAGIFGLSTYLLVAGSALWYSYAVLCRIRSAVCRAAVLGTLGALVATDFHNLFDVLYVHGMAGLMGLMIALLPLSLACQRDSSERKRELRQNDH